MARAWLGELYLWKEYLKLGQKRDRVLLQFLRENSIFKNLTHREIVLIEKLVMVRTFEQGEIIFRQNDVGLGLYIVSKGSVIISVRNPDGSGSDIPITNLKRGTFFGELALVERANIRTATATTAEKTEVIAFMKPDLMDVIERFPATGCKIAMALAKVIGRRLRDTTEALTQASQPQTDLDETSKAV